MSEITNSYLTFKLGSESFAIHVSKVAEIKEYVKPRKIPESISYMLGVADYREGVIPVVDTGLKFGLNPVEITVQTCIIVLDISKVKSEDSFQIGILADAVTDVIELDADSLGNFNEDYRPEYILGTYSINDNFHIVLNIDQIFSSNEVIQMSKGLQDLKKND